MSDVLVFMNSSYQLRLSATQDVNKRTDDIYFESAAEIYLIFFAAFLSATLEKILK